MEINYKQLRMETISKQIVIVLRTKIEMTDSSIKLIFRFKQYKNAYIANFVYYGKTLLLIFLPKQYTTIDVHL